MALAFLNNCRWRAAAGGTADFTVDAAVTGGYTPAQCANPAMVDGATYHYHAFSDDFIQHEEGDGVWDADTSTLERTTIRTSSNSGDKVNFSAAPVVHMGGPLAQDIAEVLIADVSVTNAATISSGSFDATPYTGLRCSLVYELDATVTPGIVLSVNVNDGTNNSDFQMADAYSLSEGNGNLSFEAVGADTSFFADFIVTTDDAGGASSFSAGGIGLSATTTFVFQALDNDGLGSQVNFTAARLLLYGRPRP